MADEKVTADMWDAESVDLLDHFTTDDGDHVVRVQVRGVPLIIFAYKDQSPQILAYPNGQRSIHAFNMYQETIMHQDTVMEVTEGDEDQSMPTGYIL